MRRILLAEDDRSLSRSMDTWLTLEGFQVITVFNGEEALNKLTSQKYDLLITDIAMPRLNGVELISQIRRINRGMPILVVSGNLNENVLFKLQEMDVRYFLPKPIKPTEFRRLINELFPEQFFI
jgi:DNA-binding response OmpR family regulator